MQRVRNGGAKSTLTARPAVLQHYSRTGERPRRYGARPLSAREPSRGFSLGHGGIFANTRQIRGCNSSISTPSLAISKRTIDSLSASSRSGSPDILPHRSFFVSGVTPAPFKSLTVGHLGPSLAIP